MLMRTLIVVALACLTTTLPREGEGEDAKVKLTPGEQRVLDQTNAARKAEGLDPLTVHSVLVEVARKHSETMAKLRKAEHVIDGVGPDERIKSSGYKYAAVAENIEWSVGAAEPADTAMKFWLNSKGHRANLLSKDCTEIGIGMATNAAGETYFTQVFARPRK